MFETHESIPHSGVDPVEPWQCRMTVA